MAYTLVHSQKFADYSGQIDVCVAEMRDANGTLTTAQLRSTILSEAQARGEQLLSMRIWRDGNKWKTEITSKELAWILQAVIIAVIAILVLIIIAIVVKVISGAVSDVLYGPSPILVQDPETGEWETVWEPSFLGLEGTGGNILKIVFIIGGVALVGYLAYKLIQRKFPGRT